jgi:hypothetical protein
MEGSVLFYFSFFFFFFSAGDWTQGLALDRQVFFHWAKSPTPQSSILMSLRVKSVICHLGIGFDHWSFFPVWLTLLCLHKKGECHPYRWWMFLMSLGPHGSFVGFVLPCSWVTETLHSSTSCFQSGSARPGLMVPTLRWHQWSCVLSMPGEVWGFHLGMSTQDCSAAL